VSPGPNRILESLDGIAAVHTVPLPLFKSWWPVRQEIRPARERTVGSRMGDAARRASPHLVRLWAQDSVEALLDGSAPGQKAAMALGVRYRLVTPVTGAVVLENEQQYKAAGLDPNDPTQVSSVPEPEEWMLMAIAGAIVIWTFRRRREDARGASAA
jgi:hypothetical protein